jgi:hypothetical protein
MPHNLTQTVISEHLADGTMTVGDEIALRIDLPPLQDALYADFDTSVNRIVAQPFLLNAEVDRVTATRVEGMRSVKSRSLVRSYSRPSGWQSLRSVHFAAQSVVLPAGRESVGAVAVFEFVVGGLADQALAFVPRRELIASRIQRTDVAKPPQRHRQVI